MTYQLSRDRPYAKFTGSGSFQQSYFLAVVVVFEVVVDFTDLFADGFVLFFVPGEHASDAYDTFADLSGPDADLLTHRAPAVAEIGCAAAEIAIRCFRASTRSYTR